MQTYFINTGTVEQDMRNLGQAIRRQADKKLEITIKEARRSKSHAQNAYYHFLVGLVSDETGENKDRLRVIMKDSLGYYDEFWHDGQALKNYKSMANVTISESSLFINAAQELCMHLNIKIPTKEQFYKEITLEQIVK